MNEKIKPWQIDNQQWTNFMKDGKLTLGEKVTIAQPALSHVKAIASLLQGEEALVPVDEQNIVDSINKGLALAAFDGEKVIGYQTMGLWEEMQLVELRSAKVLEEYRGHGINSVMKRLAIKMAITNQPGWPIIGFTENTSKSRGILMKFGFEELPLERVREEYPGLASICPAQCFIKSGYNCGCKVYFLNPYDQQKNK